MGLMGRKSLMSPMGLIFIRGREVKLPAVVLVRQPELNKKSAALG
jgi:hypothetical protein